MKERQLLRSLSRASTQLVRNRVYAQVRELCFVMLHSVSAQASFSLWDRSQKCHSDEVAWNGVRDSEHFCRMSVAQQVEPECERLRCLRRSSGRIRVGIPTKFQT